MYYNARYYDPDLGRFLQADTYLDGMNRYAYCGNNPIRYNDPTGHKMTWIDTGQDTGYYIWEPDTPSAGDLAAAAADAYTAAYQAAAAAAAAGAAQLAQIQALFDSIQSQLDAIEAQYDAQQSFLDSIPTYNDLIAGEGGYDASGYIDSVTGSAAGVMATTTGGGSKEQVLNPVSTTNTVVTGVIGTVVQYGDNAINSLNATRLDLLMHSRNLKIAALGYFATIDETLVVLGFSDDFAKQAQGVVNRINLKNMRLGKLKSAGKALGYAGYAYAGYDIYNQFSSESVGSGFKRLGRNGGSIGLGLLAAYYVHPLAGVAIGIGSDYVLGRFAKW